MSNRKRIFGEYTDEVLDLLKFAGLVGVGVAIGVVVKSAQEPGQQCEVEYTDEKGKRICISGNIKDVEAAAEAARELADKL